MEITESTIYWITRLDNIGGLVLFLALVSIVVGAIMLAVWCNNKWGDSWSHTDKPILKPYFIFPLTLGFILFLGLSMLPSTKEMIAIKVIPAVVNSEKAQTISAETYEAAIRIIERIGKTEEK